MVLEAILLYDKVYTYDYLDVLPFFVGEELSHSPILLQQRNEPQQYINCIDPYENLSFTNRNELFLKRFKPVIESYNDFIRPHITFNFFPEMETRLMESHLKNLKSVEFEKLVGESLEKIFDSPEQFKMLNHQDQARSIIVYLCEQIWRIDQARMLSARYSITGTFLNPDFESVWQYERANVRSALHEKFERAEEAILKTHLVDSYSKIDVSPLIVVALNRTKKPEELPETIRAMRKEYSELRSAGSKYAKMLNEAETYGEAEDVVREWSRAWEALLKRIASHSNTFPLIRKMFSWDVLKQLSARSFFLDSVETVLSEFKNLTITKKLWVVGRLEKQFLKSRLIEKRIKELYGS